WPGRREPGVTPVTDDYPICHGRLPHLGRRPHGPHAASSSHGAVRGSGKPDTPDRVGAELSQVFARFGARAAVVEALPRLLPAAEPEAGDLFATVFARAAMEPA